MGKVEQTVADTLISPIPDRNSNRVRVYRKDNGEVVIHFRQMKITLMNTVEIVEWQQGFKNALQKLRAANHLKNDL